MKGVLKSLEAVLAILMIIAAYLIIWGKGENIPDVDIVAWRVKGFDALKALDEDNKLATWSLANDTSSIKSELADLLQLGVNYDVVVCTQTCPSVSISSQKTSSVSYFVAGNATNIEPREVVLYLWSEAA